MFDKFRGEVLKTPLYRGEQKYFWLPKFISKVFKRGEGSVFWGKGDFQRNKRFDWWYEKVQKSTKKNKKVEKVLAGKS